jgi:hypothetical protein
LEKYPQVYFIREKKSHEIFLVFAPTIVANNLIKLIPAFLNYSNKTNAGKLLVKQKFK